MKIVKCTVIFIIIFAMSVLTGIFGLFGQLPIREVFFYARFLDLNQILMFKWEILGILLLSTLLVYLSMRFKKTMFSLIVCWAFFLGGVYLYPLMKRHDDSSLFENNYVLPKLIAGKKKNIIFIFWESLEDTFADEKTWGKNLIPKMTAIEENNTSFKGYKELKITGSTIKSQVATLCGIPFLSKGWGDTFIPNAKCIPDFLKEEGYYQVFMKAADTRFSNADLFAKTHSFDEILGRQDYLKMGLIKEEEKKGWGVVDSVFLRLAEDKLIELSQRKEPFFMVLTTVNTHYPHGNLEKDCPVEYNNILDNVKCSDKTLFDFTEWLSHQDFAKDTVLFIVGDHPMLLNLEMPISYTLYKYPNRNTFNVVINGTTKEKKINKNYVQFDWAPTILEESGFSLEPRRFGLGTSLTSDEKSIIDKFTPEQLDELIEISHDYFKDRFLNQK